MNACTHTKADQAAAIEDGMCPLCLDYLAKLDGQRCEGWRKQAEDAMKKGRQALVRSERAEAEITRLRTVLESIQKMAEHDLEWGIEDKNFGNLYQIEADARAALGAGKEGEK